MNDDIKLREVEDQLRQRIHDLRDEINRQFLEIRAALHNSDIKQATIDEKVKTIEEASRRLSNIVQQLRDWKNFHTATAEEAKKNGSADLNDLCDRLTAQESALAGFKLEMHKMLTSLKLAIGENKIKTSVIWGVMACLGGAVGAALVGMILKGAQ